MKKRHFEDVFGPAKKTKSERKSLESLPTDLLGVIASHLKGTKELKESARSFSESKSLFLKEQKYFEENIPDFLIKNITVNDRYNPYTDRHSSFSYNYLPNIYLDDIIKLFDLGLCLSYVPEVLYGDIYYSFSSRSPTLMMDWVTKTDYNKWFTTNRTGLIHFIVDAPQFSKKFIWLLYYPEIDKYFEESRNPSNYLSYAREILDLNKIGGEDYNFFATIAKNLGSNVPYESEVKTVSKPKWKHTDKKCIMLNDEELKTFIYNVYDDEKSCLEDEIVKPIIDPKSIKEIYENLLAISSKDKFDFFSKLVYYEYRKYNFDFEKVYVNHLWDFRVRDIQPKEARSKLAQKYINAMFFGGIVEPNYATFAKDFTSMLNYILDKSTILTKLFITQFEPDNYNQLINQSIKFDESFDYNYFFDQVFSQPNLRYMMDKLQNFFQVYSDHDVFELILNGVKTGKLKNNPKFKEAMDSLNSVGYDVSHEFELY